MSIRRLAVAVLVASVAVTAVAPAFADDGGYRRAPQEWREHEWREHEWREDARPEHERHEHAWQEHQRRGQEWRGQEWREHEWREQDWREHERREHAWREHERREHYDIPPLAAAPGYYEPPPMHGAYPGYYR